MTRNIAFEVLAGLSLAILPLPAYAHPHVFIDVALELRINEAAQIEGIEVSWHYDAFYSLLLLTDLGLDPDGDGILSDDETTALLGFDLNWTEGFAGDIYVQSEQGGAVTLSAPEPLRARVKEGKIVSTHYRALNMPVSQLAIQAYDPTFFTAYTLLDPVIVDDAHCQLSVQFADLDAAYTMVEELLYVLPSDALEENFPRVGEAFADKVQVRCAS